MSLSVCKHQRHLIEYSLLWWLFFLAFSSFDISLYSSCGWCLRSSGMWPSITFQIFLDISTLEMPPLYRLKTLGTNYSVTHLQIPEERRSQLHRCESVKPRIFYVVVCKTTRSFCYFATTCFLFLLTSTPGYLTLHTFFVPHLSIVNYMLY
jgi:hypothetical protein